MEEKRKSIENDSQPKKSLKTSIMNILSEDGISTLKGNECSPIKLLICEIYRCKDFFYLEDENE